MSASISTQSSATAPTWQVRRPDRIAGFVVENGTNSAQSGRYWYWRHYLALFEWSPFRNIPLVFSRQWLGCGFIGWNIEDVQNAARCRLDHHGICRIIRYLVSIEYVLWCCEQKVASKCTYILTYVVPVSLPGLQNSDFKFKSVIPRRSFLVLLDFYKRELSWVKVPWTEDMSTSNSCRSFQCKGCASRYHFRKRSGGLRDRWRI